MNEKSSDPAAQSDQFCMFIYTDVQTLESAIHSIMHTGGRVDQIRLIPLSAGHHKLPDGRFVEDAGFIGIEGGQELQSSPPEMELDEIAGLSKSVPRFTPLKEAKVLFARAVEKHLREKWGIKPSEEL